MAGVCMPEPNDLMAETTNKSQIKSYPKRNKMAKTRVEKAIKESERTIINFLLYLSAHTPLNGERKKVGKKPQIMDIVIITPDLVSKVIYHIMANCTNVEPNCDIV
jgi:hypothetical protein